VDTATGGPHPGDCRRFERKERGSDPPLVQGRVAHARKIVPHPAASAAKAERPSIAISKAVRLEPVSREEGAPRPSGAVHPSMPQGPQDRLLAPGRAFRLHYGMSEARRNLRRAQGYVCCLRVSRF